MYCRQCGVELSEGAKFCNSCGSPLAVAQAVRQDNANSALMGFSTKINDPAFAKYIKNTYRWSGIFAAVLAIIAIVGFYIAGENSSEMSNPDSLYIGFAIGGMFLLIAFFQTIGRKRSTTWDGVVEDKNVKKKTERKDYGDDNYHNIHYLEYKVIIRSDRGKKYEIRVRDDDTLYNYYNVGDRVRHHAGLNTYEKYDKTRDGIIPCNACASLNNINDDYCFRCKCPLLK
ncbi:MAG: zinc-ribbon domain-containing protein [Saccharofermentanales bacterium]